MRFFFVVALCAWASACAVEVESTNPYDPDTALEQQAKGTLTGSISAEAAFEPTALVLKLQGTSLRGSAVEGLPFRTEVQGEQVRFSVEAPAGTYRITASLPGFDPGVVAGVPLASGGTVDVGLVVLKAGRGGLGGRIVARSPNAAEAAPPLDTRLTLLRLVAPLPAPGTSADCVEPGLEEAVTVAIRPDGTFAAYGLAAGSYMVVAERDGYVPAMSSSSFLVEAGDFIDAGQVVMVSASSLVRVVPASDPEADVASTASRLLEPIIELAVPPVYNGLRISEDPEFADPARGDVAFATVQASVPWTLSAGDGERRLHVQFRSPTCRLSPVFTGSVVVDTRAPEAAPPVLTGERLCSNESLTALAISGADPCDDIQCAGLWKMRVAPDAQLEEAPWVEFDNQVVLDLGDDGEHVVSVQLRDRAGNVSQRVEGTVVVNTSGPALVTPAVSLASGGSTVRATLVRLLFGVEGATSVEVGNAPGLDGSAWQTLPPTKELDWRLSNGEDGAREVHVRFRDDCGNTTEELTLSLTLDRSGRVAGSVRREGATNHAGTIASLLRLDDGAYVDTGKTVAAGTDGRYELAGLEPGIYGLSLSYQGFVLRTVEAIEVTSGATATVPELQLVRARGAISGRVTLEGEQTHDGIIVTAGDAFALTDVSGAFTLTNLPVADYLLRAEKGNAYSPVTSGMLVTVFENETTDAPDMELKAVPGRIFGVVTRTGRATHAGIDVLVRGLTVGGSVQARSTVTDDGGGWQLTDLTAGQWSASFSSAGFETARAEGLLLAAGGEVDAGVTTLAPATGDVGGQVLLAGETNHSGVRVSLSQGGVERDAAVSDSSGLYALSDAPAGEYTLTLARTGFATRRVTSVVVQADLVTTIPVQTLTRQVGEVSLKDVGLATNLTTVEIEGAYPNAVAARTCENPLLSDASGFSTDDCPWRTLTFTTGGAFDALPVTFKASPCAGAGGASAVCDGAKLIRVKFRDAANEESEWFELPVVLDRVAPEGHVVIEPLPTTLAAETVVDSGSAWTRTSRSRVLVVARDARDGVPDGAAVAGVTAARLYRSPTDDNPLVISLTDGVRHLDGFTLAAGGDGVRRVLVQLVDGAGNVSSPDPTQVTCPQPLDETPPSACDTILLDTTPIGSLRFSVAPRDPEGDLSEGASHTTTPLVLLGIDSTQSGLPEDEAVEAIVANDSNFASAVVQPLASPRSLLNWFLASGDGTKTVYVKVRDRAGNLSAVFSDTIELDSVSPDVPVLRAVGAWTTNPQPSLVFGAVAGADVYRLQLSDGVSFDAGGTLHDVTLAQGPWTPSGPLADGTWYWRVGATDAAGHASGWSAVDVFSVDTLSPAAPELEQPPALTQDATPELRWSRVADAATYTLELDTSASFDSAARLTATLADSRWVAPTLADGQWHVRVRAHDAAGNVSVWSAPGAFSVDTSAPSNPVLTAPASGAVLASSSVTFEWAAVVGAGSYLLQVGIGANPASWDEYPVTGTRRTLPLPDGAFTFRVAAVDEAGNRSDLSAATRRSFTIDTVAPETPVLSYLANLLSTRSPTFAWSDTSGSGAVGYVLNVDERSYAPSTHTHTPAESLADGAHTWTVAAVDAAGNRSAFAAPQTFTVDATAPARPTLAAVATPTTTSQPVWTWSGAPDAVEYTVEWDQASSFDTAKLASANVTGTTTQPTTPLTDGLWYVRVTARDAAGNASPPSAVISFVVDTQAPADATLTSPAPGATVTSATVSFTWAAVADATTYRLELAAEPTFAAPQVEGGVTATARTMTLSDGSWWVRVVSVDAAGNRSPGAASRAFHVDTQAPATPVVAAVPSPTNDATPTFTWSNESASGATAYRVLVDGVAVTVSTTTHTPATALSDGSHTLSVAALDAAGNASPPSAVQLFTVDTTAPATPTLTAVSPDPSAAQTQTLRWSVVPGAVIYEAQWDVNPAFNSPSLGTSQLTADRVTVGPLAEGQWHWRVRASDDAGNQSAWSSADDFLVDTTAPAAPTLATPPDGALLANATVTFMWNASAGASAYLFDLAQAATFLTWERVEISGTSRSVTLPEGDRWWRVLAKDDAGNVSAAASSTIRKVTVDTVAPATPVLVAVASPTAQTQPQLAWGAVDGAASYVVILDGQNTPVATTSWTPAALSDGTHVWTVAAVDAAGNTGTTAPSQAFVVDATAPDAPQTIPVTPDPGADNTPSGTWLAVAGAVEYLVEWDTAATFNTAAKATTTTSSTQATLGPLANGTWYWRVFASDAVGNRSVASTIDSFVVDTDAPAAPALTAPADGATLTSAPVTLSWSPVAGAVSYRLQIAKDASLGTIIQDMSGLTATSQLVTLADDAYWWRVLATDASGNQTPPAEAPARAFTVDATAPATPTLTAFATPTSNARPLFTWTDMSGSGATEYVLSLDATQTPVPATSYQPSSNLADGAHSVRVASRDAAGNQSAFSAAFDFVVDTTAPSAPQNASPGDLVTLTTPQATFTWSASTDAASPLTYTLQVSRADDFLSLVVHDTAGDLTRGVSLADGDYHWRVRATDPAGNHSAWSPSITGHALAVDTTAPTAPVPVAVGTLVNASPTLQWPSSAATGATSYEVQVDDDPAFGSPEIDETTASNSHAATLADGAWSWRVRAVDAHGNRSGWSTVDAFTLDTQAPGAPTGLTPANNHERAVNAVTFAWTAPAGGAVGYLLEVAYDAAFSSLAQSVSTTATTTSLTFPDGSYHWRVRARDEAGNQGAAASGGRFLIDTDSPRRPVLSAMPTWVSSATTQLAFSWSDESDSGAVDYLWQLSTSPAFGTIAAADVTTSTSVTRAPPAAEATHYLRVSARDALGNASAWSAVASFAVDLTAPTQPVRVLPTEGIAVSTGIVGLTWTSATDAHPLTYELQVGQEPTFTNQVVVALSTTATQSVQSLAEGAYYWRVRAVDAAGNASEAWTESYAGARTFVVDTTPPDGTSFLPYPPKTSDARPNLQWSLVTDATAYLVLIDDDSDFASPQQTISLTGAALRTSLLDGDYSSPLPDGLWYARVSTGDEAGNVSPPSPTLSFTVDTEPPQSPATCALTPAAPYGPAIANSTPTFEWAAATGASSFLLRKLRDVAGSFVQDSLLAGLPTNGAFPVRFTLPDEFALAQGERYQFVVQAVDDAGNTSAGTVCRTNGSGAVAVRYDAIAPVSAPAGLAVTPTTPTSSPTVNAGWTAAADPLHGGELGYTARLLAQNGITVLRTQTVAWKAPFVPGPRSVSFANVADGTYLVQLVGWDAAGNESPAALSAPHVVDSAPPSSPLMLDPLAARAKEPQRTGSPTPTFTWSDESNTGATSYTLRVHRASNKGAPTSLVHALAGLTGTSHTLTEGQSLTDGYYVWDVASSDAAGNSSQPSRDTANGQPPFLQVDATAPSPVSNLNRPGVGQSMNSDDLAFSFDPSASSGPLIYRVETYDAAGTLVFSTACAMADGTSCQRNTIIAEDALSVDGTYHWRVRVEDDLGNASAWTPAETGAPLPSYLPSFILDNAAPRVPAPLTPEPNAFQKTCLVNFSWTDESESGATGHLLFVQKKSGNAYVAVSGHYPRKLGAVTSYSSSMSGCAGAYRWWVVSMDEAGNESQSSPISSFLIDQTAPPAPTLTSVEGRNRAARVFWNAVSDPSGIAEYRVHCGTTANPTALCATASADATDVVAKGLANKAEYYFRVTAVDSAGNVSAYSDQINVPVGWKRTSLPIDSVYPIRPLDIATSGNDVYVTYSERDADWTVQTGNLKVAVSNDGGDSWRFITLDSEFAWDRHTAPIGLTDTGVVIASAGTAQVVVDSLADPPTAWADRGAMKVWFSGDSGTTWERKYDTSADTNRWARMSGVGLWASGSWFRAIFQKAADSGNSLWDLYSTNGGASVVSMSSYYTPTTSYSNTSDLRACAANYTAYTFWRSSDSQLRSLTHYYLTDGAITAGNDEGIEQTVAASGVNQYTSACLSLPEAPIGLVSTVSTNALHLRRKLSPTGSWTSLLLRSDAASTARPAMWAGGRSVFVAYRDTQGRLMLGSSDNIGASGSWSGWSALDTNPTNGHYVVMAGSNVEDVALAFTDEEGYTLSVMRPVLPAMQAKPIMGVGTATLTWDAVAGADRYEVGYGPQSSAPWSNSSYTSQTTFPIAAGTTHRYEVRPLDEHGQPGNDGPVWKVAPFTESTVAVSTQTSALYTSNESDVVAWDSGATRTVLVLAGPDYGRLTGQSCSYEAPACPAGYTCSDTVPGGATGVCQTPDALRLFRSNDGGATFTTESASSIVTPVRALAGGGGSAVLVYRNSTTLSVRHYPSITSSSNTLTNLASGTSADHLSVKSDGASRVAVLWSEVANDQLRFAWSTNGGSTFTVQTPIPIPSPATYAIGTVTVGRISGNKVVVFWRQDSSDYARVYYAETADAGLTWSSPRLVHTSYLPSLTSQPVSGSTMIAASGNAAYGVQLHVTGQNLIVGLAPNLTLSTTGPDYNVSTASTSGYFTTQALDRDQINESSFDAVSNDSGHYVAYGSTSHAGTTIFNKLEMGFCSTNCHLLGSWLRRTLRTFDSNNGIHGSGTNITVDNNGRVYVLFRERVGSDRHLKLLYGGELSRTR